ncbi:MAG: sugar phosphate isomerase/epimerase [Thermomicrobiales bacterium]|nr:sugar phosphate isomerase/epimerase [Thermomicrobiales bacterium]
MRYALFTVSSPTMTLEELAPKLHEYGYEGWELRVVDEPPNPKGMEFWHGNKSTVPASTFKDEVPRLQKLAEDNHLELINLGTYVRSDSAWANIEQAFANAVAIGAPSLRINVPEYDGKSTLKPIWDTAFANFKRIEELAAQHNVKVLTEIHHGTICPSASSMRMFVGGLDPKHIGVIHDCGNMVHEGYENYRLGLEMLGEYLALVHVKNVTMYPFRISADSAVEWRHKWWPMHQGVASIRAVISTLMDIGYDGWISFEDFSTQQKFEDRAKFNIDFVKQIVEEERTKRTTPES